jgi:hypothetical protein
MALTPEQQAMDFNPELQDINRQQKLAELLMAQGMQGQPQGQMISGYYVAPSFTQQLNPLAKMLAGQAVGEKADVQQAKLAEALRTQKGEALATFQELMSKPETRGQAMQYAAKNQFLQPLVSELMKPQKLAEGENLVMPSINGEKPINLGAGGAKYHAPISIDTGNSTILLDPITKQKIAEYPKAHQPVAGQVLETENGPMLVNTRTGQASPVMAGGQPLAGGKPLTESQGNATAFGMRMKESNQLLNDLERKGVTDTGVVRSTVGGIVGMTPFIGEKLQQGVQSSMNVLPSALGGPNSEQQQVDAARKNFITAVLRKESGAAISPSEFYTEGQKYFPQPGDSNAVILQKRHARDTAIKAMEIQAGPGKRQIEQMGTPKKVVNFNDLP